MYTNKKIKLIKTSNIISFVLLIISLFFFICITTTYSFSTLFFILLIFFFIAFVVGSIYNFKLKKKKINFKKLLKWLPFYIIIIPGFTYLLINNVIPLYGITIAFRKINIMTGVLKSPFWGFKDLSNFSFFYNFKMVFNKAILGNLLKNTIGYNLIFIVIDIVIPSTVAILFTTIQNKPLKKLYQTLILMPNVISWVIASYLVYAFLAPGNGFLTKLFGGVDFYHTAKYWPFILTFVHIWKSIGFGMVIYIAGLAGIDESIYESARIDGASWIQRVIYITLPELKTLIITLFILNLSKIMVSDFGLFYQIPKNMGMLKEVTQTLDVYVYNSLINGGNFTNSSAISVFQSSIGFLLVVGSNLIIRKIDRESALF